MLTMQFIADQAVPSCRRVSARTVDLAPAARERIDRALAAAKLKADRAAARAARAAVAEERAKLRRMRAEARAAKFARKFVALRLRATYADEGRKQIEFFVHPYVSDYLSLHHGCVFVFVREGLDAAVRGDLELEGCRPRAGRMVRKWAVLPWSIYTRLKSAAAASGIPVSHALAFLVKRGVDDALAAAVKEQKE